MPRLPDDKLRRWRIHPHAIDVYLYLLKPTLVFRARVTGLAFTYPLSEIGYAAVEVGSASDILPGMTVRVGSEAGKADFGTTFVRSAPVGANPIQVGRSSRGTNRPGELSLQSNAVLEVWDMREAWAEPPYITPDGTTYKKLDIPFNANTDPVANAGPDFADFVDPADNTLTVYFDTAGGSAPEDDFPSFATSPGAVITDYDWDFADGTPSSSSSATPGNVSFPLGARYISLTVTDSNSRTHTAYALIAACPKAGPGAPIYQMQVTEHSERINGQTLKAQIREEIDRANYPAGTRVLLFGKERYGRLVADTSAVAGNLASGLASTDQLYVGMLVEGVNVDEDEQIAAGTTITEIVSSSIVRLSTTPATDIYHLRFKPVVETLAGGSNRRRGLMFSGWLVDEQNQLEFRAEGIQKNVTITAEDICGRLARLPGFPQEIRRKTVPTKWTEMKEPHIGRYLHYILHYHSNALALADFKWSAEDYPFSWLSSGGRSLYDQANERAEAVGARLACDIHGRLMITFDQQLVVNEQRTGVEQVEIGAADWQRLSWRRDYVPRNHWLRAAALFVSTADVDSATAAASFAIAPGRAPGQGVAATSQNYQLVKTAAEHYTREGNRYAAKLNAEAGLWEVALVSGGEAGIEIARGEWVRVKVDNDNQSLRGEAFPDGRRFLPVEKRHSYDPAAGIRRTTLTVEEEVVGTPAEIDPQPLPNVRPLPGSPTPGWNPWIPPIITFGPEDDLDPEDDAVPVTAVGVVKEGLVFRATWPAGSPAWQDISPSSPQRAAIDEAIRLTLDANMYQKAYLFGRGGILRTTNIMASAPVWQQLLAAQTYQTVGGSGYGGARLGANGWSRDFDFTQGNQDFAAHASSDTLLGSYVQGVGWRSVVNPSNSSQNVVSVRLPAYRGWNMMRLKLYYSFSGTPNANQVQVTPFSINTTHSTPPIPTTYEYQSILNGRPYGFPAPAGQDLLHVTLTVSGTGIAVTLTRIEIEGYGDDPFEVDWTHEFDFANGEQNWAPFADGTYGGSATFDGSYWSPVTALNSGLGMYQRVISIRYNGYFPPAANGWVKRVKVYLSNVARGVQEGESTDVIFTTNQAPGTNRRFSVSATRNGSVVHDFVQGVATIYHSTLGLRIVVSTADTAGEISGTARVDKIVISGSGSNPFLADTWVEEFDFTESDHLWWTTGSTSGAAYTPGTGFTLTATDPELFVSTFANPCRVTQIDVYGTISASDSPAPNNQWRDLISNSGGTNYTPASWQDPAGGAFHFTWTGGVKLIVDGDNRTGMRIFLRVKGTSKSITVSKIVVRGEGLRGLQRWRKNFDFREDRHGWVPAAYNESAGSQPWAVYVPGQGWQHKADTHPTVITITMPSGIGWGSYLIKMKVTMSSNTDVNSVLMMLVPATLTTDSSPPFEWIADHSTGHFLGVGDYGRVQVSCDSAYAGYIQQIELTGVGPSPYEIRGGTNISLTETLFSDFQCYPKKASAFCWLSRRQIEGVDTVFFCYTTDSFATPPKAVSLAVYREGAVHAIAINPHNWLDVVVACGGKLWRSTTGGASFSIVTGDVPILENGGCIVWNWSTGAANVKNHSINNLLILQGVNDDDEVMVVRGPGGTPVDIVTDASRYPDSPMSLRVLPKDLDFARYLARTGHFYGTDNASAGLTWSYKGTAPDGGGEAVHRGMVMWPTDASFAFIYGTNVLCYTLNAGTSFTNLWSAFNTWRDGEWGSGIGTEIKEVILDLSGKYKNPVV